MKPKKTSQAKVSAVTTKENAAHMTPRAKPPRDPCLVNHEDVLLQAAREAAQFCDVSRDTEKITLKSRFDFLKLDVSGKMQLKFELSFGYPKIAFENQQFAEVINCIGRDPQKNPTLRKIAQDIRNAIQEEFERINS